MTLVVGGATQPAPDLQAAAEEALGLAAGGMKLKAAVAQVARQQGLAKNAVYELALKTQRSTAISCFRGGNAPLTMQIQGVQQLARGVARRCLTHCRHRWWTPTAISIPPRPNLASSPTMPSGWLPRWASPESCRSDVIRRAAAGRCRLRSAGRR